MSAPPSQTADLRGGVSFAYRSLPAAPNPSLPTILMIHSFMTDSSFFTAQFTDPDLADHAGTKWNLIAIDVHGHGNTTGRDTFNYWDTAHDAGLLMEHLGLKDSGCFVLGTSQGGFMAVRMAILYPALVRGVVMAGSTMLSETPESAAGITALTTDFPNNPALLKQCVQVSLGVDYESDTATERGKTEGQKWANVWKGRYGGEKAHEERFQKVLKQLLDRDDIVGKVEAGEVKVPVVIMHGTQDLVYPVAAHAEPSAEILRKAGILEDYVVVEGGWHYLSWGNWEQVDKRLVELVEKYGQ